MNKIFSKVAALSVGLAMAIGVGVALGSNSVREVKADSINFDISKFNGKGTASTGSAMSVTDGDITLSFDKGYGSSATDVRSYAGGSLTFSGVTFTKIVITATADNRTGGTWTPSTGTVTKNGAIITWTGSASSALTLANSAQLRMASLTITYDEGGDTPTPSGHAGTADDPYTVAEALVQCGTTSTTQWYVKGIISRFEKFDSKYSSAYYYISDDGTTTNELYVYSGKDINGAAFTADTAARLTQGKIVVVKGILKTYNSTKEFDKNNVLISIEEPAGTKYAVVNRVDNGALDKDEVAEGADLTVTIIPEIGYWYPESVTVLMAGSAVEFTYTNGVVVVENVTGNVSIEGACVACNQIKALYAQPNGTVTGDFYGYYVGYLTHTNKDGSITYYDYIIQDGEFGIMLYGASTSEPEFVAGETILKASGTISVYNGLYEVASPVVEAATSVPEEKVPANPVIYAAQGGETYIYANRLTSVTGVPTVTKGNFDDAAGTGDINMSFAVGSNSVHVFYKKAAQLADADAFAAVKEAVTNSTEVTVKGFTGWYNEFQVQMNGYIAPAEDYTAEEFAQDLLTQTDAVCTGWKEGDNNHDALEAIWSDLASNDKYPALPAAQKTILAEAARDPEGSVIEQAMARYDFLTGKYNLSNFINGRTPVVTANTRFGETDLAASDNTMIIVVTIAAVSALAFTTLLVFKKKRQK